MFSKYSRIYESFEPNFIITNNFVINNFLSVRQLWFWIFCAISLKKTFLPQIWGFMPKNSYIVSIIEKKMLTLIIWVLIQLGKKICSKRAHCFYFFTKSSFSDKKKDYFGLSPLLVHIGIVEYIVLSILWFIMSEMFLCNFCII